MTSDFVVMLIFVARGIYAALIIPVFPMIMKESKVMDNLVNLRRGLASFLITGWLLNIVLFFYQALRLSSVTVPQLAIDLAGTVNAIYVMSVASAIYLIYSDKYRK